MLTCETKYFGTTEYSENSVIEFAAEIPGFEEEKHFIPIGQGQSEPVVFLQSLDSTDLCFVTLPVLVIDPKYRLDISAVDRELLGLARDRRPVIGEQVLCLAILSIKEGGSTANLMAPLVVSLKTNRAVQAIAAENGYSHQHPLRVSEPCLC